MGDTFKSISGAEIADIVTTGGVGSILTKKSGIGKKKKAAGQNLDEALADAALEFLDVSRGLRDDFFDQLTRGLETGRLPDELLPQAQAGIEQVLVRGSQEAQAVKDIYATGGQGRSAAAQRSLADTRLATNQAKELVPTDVLNSILLASPNAVIGQAGQTGLQGLGALSEISAQQAAARAQRSGAVLGALATGAGGLAASGIKAYSLYQPTTTPGTPGG